MTAHQLHASGFDVIVAYYETYRNDLRPMLKIPEIVGNINENGTQFPAPNPKRPTCGLASDLGHLTGRLWKRVVLDEVQSIKRWDCA